MLSWDTRKLSQAAMETLAIVAYLQPCTRAGVASVRGVNSDSSINSLVEKGLIREAGQADAPGNPTLYATTRGFLEKFGLRSVDVYKRQSLELAVRSVSDGEGFCGQVCSSVCEPGRPASQGLVGVALCPAFCAQVCGLSCTAFCVQVCAAVCGLVCVAFSQVLRSASAQRRLYACASAPQGCSG